MRFAVALWMVCVAGVTWGQAAFPPGRNVFLPKPANLTTDPPEVFLREYANAYQALKAGHMPDRLGSSFMLARGMLDDPRRCIAPLAVPAIAEFSTSFQRLAGRTESTMASNREIVLTSIARYSCADSDADGTGRPVTAVPGYEMMSRMKGTFAETIAPRQRTVLPGMSDSQAQAFQQFGDLTQRFRTDPGAPMAPGTIAARIAAAQEIAKLPPEQRQKAVDELNARYAKEKTLPAEQTRLNAMAGQIVGALSAQGDAAPKPLAFLQLLQPREAYVDLYKYYVREDDRFGALHYLAVVSDKQGSRLVRLGPAEPIDAAIAAYVTNTSDRKLFETHWRDLQGLVLQPVLAALPAGTTTVWVSPDSDLFSLPFASLALELRPDLSVTVVPSAYDLSRLTSTAAGSPTGKVLLVGDLVGQEGPAAGQAIPLAALARQFDGHRLEVQKLSGRDAMVSTVTSGMKDAQYILFSTHGRWTNSGASGTAETFGSAGIELSAQDDGSANSVLTAADVLKIDLSRSELVVLLACETAQGQPVNGQGSLGFQSAFMASGARSLLVALWRVPADASQELIRNFYSGLFERHLSRAEALKQAQAALRAQPQFADPWNWGGWVLVGDPRPVMSPGG